ncbi:hypothetical protein HDU97_002008 [Phlyctochytrium planicorne]|nr:hypothetical protein HDU97_002008 [Phlyctochytrium planicorne]
MNGRVVKADEEPLKFRVFKRVKREDFDGPATEIRQVPLFAIWQTVEAERPVLINGKIPKTKFGNVDLFHPRMLPEGTVHLTCE